jgi:hypothetical protein
VDVALDDRRVGDDPAVQLEHDMDAADRVLPVIVGESVILIGAERDLHQRPDGGDLARRQLVGREPAQAQALGLEVQVAVTVHRPILARP